MAGCRWCLLFSAVCGVLGAVVSVCSTDLCASEKYPRRKISRLVVHNLQARIFEQQDECPGVILKYCLGIKSCGCLTLLGAG